MSLAYCIHKYQAMGNDMLVIDPAQFELALTPARAWLLCDRHFGGGRGRHLLWAIAR
ncbi:MAG: hypothetical protein M5U34_14135 [Chloroflexi bacterium]|nr:hypothetical protein [Chloroflexota bacterium]